MIDSVKHLAFHHNRIDNFNDDGIYLSLPPRVAPPEDVRIYENLVSRIYTTLAFAEADDHTPAPIGTGVYVYRNVFDLRDGTYTWIAKDASGAPTISASRLCGDHGSPTWEPLLFYHNTVVTAGPAVRDYYAAQLVMGTRGTRRRIFNNAFVQIEGNPGLNVPSPGDDLEADGNLLWGLKAGPAFHGDFFAARKARPGTLGAHDVFGDPRLARRGRRRARRPAGRRRRGRCRREATRGMAGFAARGRSRPARHRRAAARRSDAARRPRGALSRIHPRVPAPASAAGVADVSWRTAVECLRESER